MADTEATAVIGRYRRYKAGTKKVVSWLAQNASHCCDIAAKFNCFKPNSKSESEIKVPTKVLTALADIIVSAEANLPIPEHILQVLEDVIDLRTDCAAWYETQAISDGTDLAARNQSHKHFISVLKGVRASSRDSGNVVAPVSTGTTAKDKKSSKSKKNKTSKKDGRDGLANLFEMLDIEEPVPATLGQAPSIAPTTAKQWQGKFFALEDDQDNEAVALWCFLADMNDVRQYVRQLWLEYLEGQTSLGLTGMVTETALGMIERAGNDFVQQYHHFGEWDRLLDYLRVSMGVNGNLVYVYCKDKDAFASQTQRTGSPTDLICPSAGLLLHSFAEAAYRFLVTSTKANIGSLGGYVNADMVRSPRPITDFESVLLDIVPEITSLKSYIQAYEHTGRPK